MIDKVSIKALKSFPDMSVKIERLTLLSGLNNSGKSTLIQAIRMYSAAAKKQSPLLYGHGPVEEIRSKLSSKKDDIKVEISFQDGARDLMSLSDSDVVAPEKCPEVFYVGADRLGPQAFLPLNRDTDITPLVGDRGQFVIDFINKFSSCIIPDKICHESSQAQTFEHVTRGWLSEISPGIELGFDINSRADISQALIDNYRATNVGFGLSYTLPVIAAVLGSVAMPPSGGWHEPWGETWYERKRKNGVLLVLENPEAHLHPKGQTAIGKLIAIAASLGAQIIVETHSDHLMDGIRIAVKENLLSSTDVVFHYFSKDKNGCTSIESPEINDEGKVNYWPSGFFDQTLKNRALLARRKK